MNASVTGLDTPCRVRSPVTEYEVVLDWLTRVDANVIVGYSDTLKKSRLFR